MSGRCERWLAWTLVGMSSFVCDEKFSDNSPTALSVTETQGHDEMSSMPRRGKKQCPPIDKVGMETVVLILDHRPSDLCHDMITRSGLN